MAEIDTLHVLQHNVLAWKPHKAQLQQIFKSLDPHILINAHGCREREGIKIHNYSISKKNRTNDAHDGVAIGVRRDINFIQVPLQDMMAVRVKLAHEEVVVATGYCPFRRSSLPIRLEAP